jgi:antitoxin component of RelBE/YafQ-DinJ toxin-antitoxin module
MVHLPSSITHTLDISISILTNVFPRVYTTAMKTAVLNVKLDPAVKSQAKAMAISYGIPLGTIVNAFLLQMVQTGVIHIARPEQMTKEMERAIGIAEAEIAGGKISGPFDTTTELFDHLDTL